MSYPQRTKATIFQFLQLQKSSVLDVYRNSPKSTLLIFFISTLFSVIAYNQGDLNHTVKSSYAFIDGHIFDFYDFNKIVVGGNDYFPLMYLVFAAWMLPLKPLGLLSDSSLGFNLSTFEIFWAKLFLFLVLFASFLVLKAISEFIFKGDKQAQITTWLAYLLSPFALFAVTIFGQYDVIGVFVTLFGFYFYLKKQTKLFVICFALAISFKFFAVLVFIPLVLIRFKKITQVALIFTLGFSAVLFQTLIYFQSLAFRQGAFRLITSKSGNSANQSLTILVGIVVIVGCIYLWRKKFEDTQIPKYAIYATSLIFGLMFLVVEWHPQWVVILTPYFALSLGYLRRPAWFLIWESLAFISFIWVVVNKWVHNVDNSMIERGPLRELFTHHNLLMSDFMEISRTREFSILLTIFFLSPIIFLILENTNARKKNLVFPSTLVWNLRALIVLLVWTIPTLFAFWVPVNIAIKIAEVAPAYNSINEILVADGTIATSLLLADSNISQEFIASKNGLQGVSIRAATYKRKNQGELLFRLFDSKGNQIAEKVQTASSVREDKQTFMWFEPQLQSQGEKYLLVISTSNKDENFALSFWQSSEPVHFGKLTVGNSIIDSDLEMALFYK